MHRRKYTRSIALILGLLAIGAVIAVARPSVTRADHSYRSVNLRAMSVSQTIITIRWDANMGVHAPTHMLQTNANPDGVWSTRPLSRQEAEDRVLTFTGLQHSTTYRFRILDCLPNCLFAVSLDVTTLAPPPPPSAPTNLHLCGSGLQPEVCVGGGLLFRWTDNATTEQRYEFQWARGKPGTLPRASEYTTVTLSVNQTSYTFSPPSGGYYYFRVRACNASGCSAFSNFVERRVAPAISPAP